MSCLSTAHALILCTQSFLVKSIRVTSQLFLATSANTGYILLARHTLCLQSLRIDLVLIDQLLWTTCSAFLEFSFLLNACWSSSCGLRVLGLRWGIQSDAVVSTRLDLLLVLNCCLRVVEVVGWRLLGWDLGCRLLFLGGSFLVSFVLVWSARLGSCLFGICLFTLLLLALRTDELKGLYVWYLRL